MTRVRQVLIAVAAALALFWSDGAAAQATWAEFITATSYNTENFRVLYQKKETTAAYAKNVGDYIQEAREKILGRLGYKEPDDIEGSKLDVYVRDIPFMDFAGFVPAGVAYWNSGSPWIEINLQNVVWRHAQTPVEKEHVLKALVAHEFFHIVQYGYDPAERSWLKEATATWIEDKVFEPPEGFWESTGWVERIGEWIDNREELSTLSSKGTNEYDAAVFFQYLSEKRPGSDNIVRRIWEEAAKRSGPNSYAAIATALGDSAPWGRNMRARIGEFAVATLIQSPSLNSTYGFRKRERMTQSYAEGDHPEIWFDETYELQRGVVASLAGEQISPQDYSLKPLQPGYFQIVPPQTSVSALHYMKDPANLGRLEILVRGKTHRDWDFRLLEIPRRGKSTDPIEGWTVKRFPDASLVGEWKRLEVEDFPNKDIVIVAVNTETVTPDEEIGTQYRTRSLKRDDFEIAAALLTPPVVTSFEALVSEGPEWRDDWRSVWKVVRDVSSRPGTWRTRQVLTEGLKYDKDDPQSVRFKVQTSRPVLDAPALMVGGKPVTLEEEPGAKTHFSRDIKSSYYKKFTGDVPMTLFREAIQRLEAGEKVVMLDIALEGHDSWGGRFDENVATAPWTTIKDNGQLQIERWEGDHSGPGGKDKLSGRKLPLHQLSPSAYLSELRAFQKDALIYHAEWRPSASREGARQLDVKVSKPYDPDESMKVFPIFSKDVVGVKVRLASATRRYYPEGYSVTPALPFPEGHTAYEAEIPPSDAVKQILKEDGQLAFYIDAERKDGPKIDGDPRTAAWFDWDDERWYALEEMSDYGGHTDKGGTDEWHKLNALGKSFVLLLDASGSMADSGRMPAAKTGITKALANMKATDEAALIVFYGCNAIRVEVPFTQNVEDITKALQAVQPSGNTPLGDAIRFANRYLQSSARFPNRKLLTFSDGVNTCGSSAASAVAEIEPDKPDAPEPPEEEDKPKEIRWTLYRVGSQQRPHLNDYWVEETEYRESDYEDASKDKAQLTLRRYPVSYVTSRGRTVWSINWSRPRERERRAAAGGQVPALRARAEGLREGAMEKGSVAAAMQRLIGPDAVALRSSR